MYALKFVLRAEGPRDYVDILLSMEYQPTITVVDMAHMVATHGNIRKPYMFAPYEGRIADANIENIERAERNSLTVDMPWVNDKPNEKPLHIDVDHQYTKPIHPITGLSDHYCLFDVFHENNTVQRKEILRRTKFVPQLSGSLNTQVEEQLHRAYTRDSYFLDGMSSTNHIFIFRSNIDIRNEQFNDHAKQKIHNTTKMTISEGQLGRLIATKGNISKINK